MDPPPKEEIEDFWKGIWCEEKEFNSEAKWLRQLESENFKDIYTKVQHHDRRNEPHNIQTAKQQGSWTRLHSWILVQTSDFLQRKPGKIILKFIEKRRMISTLVMFSRNASIN